MFLVKYELENEIYFNIFYKNQYGYRQFCEDTFSPIIENLEILDLKVSGKTYKEKQEYLRDLAMIYQYYFAPLSWSYSELVEICDFFEKNGKRYGLLKEFKENAIC